MILLKNISKYIYFLIFVISTSKLYKYIYFLNKIINFLSEATSIVEKDTLMQYLTYLDGHKLIFQSENSTALLPLIHDQFCGFLQ